jgi:hypothetical protein
MEANDLKKSGGSKFGAVNYSKFKFNQFYYYLFKVTNKKVA